MATKESLAIREELATLRIQRAVQALSVKIGKRMPDFDLSSTRVVPQERQALSLEKLADILESAAGVTVDLSPVPKPEGRLESQPPPVTDLRMIVESESYEETDDAGDYEDTGGGGLAQQATGVIPRSQTIGKRRKR